MSEFAPLGEAVRLAAAATLVLAGLAIMIGGAIGVLRFPDFYTRLHAWMAAHGAGAVLVVAGLAVAVFDWAITLKLALLAVLIAALAPLLAQLLANAAHSGGLAPLSGPYLAPRPGAGTRREEGP